MDKNLIHNDNNTEDKKIKDECQSNDNIESEINSEYEENYILSLKSIKEEYYPIFQIMLMGFH